MNAVLDSPRPLSRALRSTVPFLLLVATALLAPPPAAAVTLETRVLTSADDAEEFSTGSVYLTSTDLELVFDTNLQTVGMRWAALAIPPGATITNAWIQFAAKEAHTEATTLTLRAQAADNAPVFAGTASNVSSRPRTTAAATWTPAAWLVGETGANQRTSNLSTVIQEVVSRPGWASGNALAIIVTGTGHRTAYAYDGKPASAPLLHIEYTGGGGSEPPPVAHLSAAPVASPPLTVSADGSTSTDAGAMPIASYRFDFGDGTAPVITTAPTAIAQHTYASAGTYVVSLIATDTGGYASAADTAAVIVAAAPPPPPPPGTVEKRVTANADDAEEAATGGVALTSSDLELVFDGNNQTVGMRWTALAIPPGATITNAWIQFAAKEGHTEVTPLTLRGQAADNPGTFLATNGNVSTRVKTGASVSWSPAAWTVGQAGAAQRTPNLSAVIQEIVSRPGWANGNALAVIITGTGHRTAWAYEGNAASAPLLHVEYGTGPVEPPPVAHVSAAQVANPALTVSADGSTSTDPGAMPIATYRFDFGDGTAPVTTNAPNAVAQHSYTSAGTYVVSLIATDTGGYASSPDTAAVIVSPAPPPPPTPQTTEKRVTASADDAEEAATGGVALTSSDLELVFDGNNQTVGLRWTALAIPPGATITNAWIQFAAKEAHTEVTPLTLRGQAADNPGTFLATNGNVSTRVKTGTSVSWSPAAWTAGQAGAAQRTPNLSAVIQEIVSRPGWANGNALAVIITGTGHRTAWAYEGNAASAPLLHVEFTGVASEPPPVGQLTATQVASPPLTVSASGAGSTDTGSMPIASYRFDFGDGTAQVTTTVPTATAQHTYASSGVYTVTLIVTDTGGYASAPVTASVTVASSGGPQIAVYTGYYDTHHPGLTKPKPNPWRNSANTVFVGTPDSPNNNEWDSACIRIVNLGSTTLTGVVTTAHVGSKSFALWGTNSIAPGQNLILAQTGFENFDGSDLNQAGCYDCNPADCLTKVSSIIPQVRITINGTTTTYYDAGQQLNTNGVDAAGCPYTGERNDESEQWEQITTQAPAGPASQQDEAGDVSALQPIARTLWLGAPYPNPCADRVVLRFGLKSMGLVRLGLYDVTGRLVRRSVDSVLEADEYQHMMKLDHIPSGAYYCRLETPDGVLQRTIMVVR